MRLHALPLVVVAALATAACACEFRYDPVSVPQYYRVEGWDLPGVRDYDPRGAPRTYGTPPVAQIPGAVIQLLPHDDPYVVRLPSEVFTLNGVRQRMRPMLAKATIIRVEVGGKIVAYSYGLIPISSAVRKRGRWVVTGELGCIFYATFIDDKGDGIFRLLVPGPLTADLIPQWAKPSPKPSPDTPGWR